MYSTGFGQYSIPYILQYTGVIEGIPHVGNNHDILITGKGLAKVLSLIVDDKTKLNIGALLKYGDKVITHQEILDLPTSTKYFTYNGVEANIAVVDNHFPEDPIPLVYRRAASTNIVYISTSSADELLDSSALESKATSWHDWNP